MNWATGAIRIAEVWVVLQTKKIIQNIRNFICRRYGGFTEEFKPQGAESLPDAVNSSTEWNGKLEDAYSELAKVLDCIRAVQDDINVSDCAISLTSVYQTSGDYEEGSTNLTYHFRR